MEAAAVRLLQQPLALQQVLQQVFQHPVSIGQYGRRTRARSDLTCKTDANALTVAEFDNVVVVEETDHMDEETRRRWLYTSTTRAKRNLVIIGR